MDSKEAGQIGFNLPHDIVTLPSGGKFYKNKKKSVKVGFLTASDENHLTNIKKADSQSIINALIRNKLYEPDLKPEMMLDGDIEAILVFLRNTSFGSEYNLPAIDPETGEPFVGKVDLSELNIKQSSVEPDEEGLFIVTLPKSNVTAKIKLLTFGEDLDIVKQLENYPQGLVPPKATQTLLHQIVELNGTRDKGEIAKAIEKMPIMDSKYIRNFLIENEPRYDLKRELIAPSGRKVTLNVTFGVEFFRPFF
jgi:hypothetical protein